MIPYGAIGRAASDAISKPRYGGGGSGSRGGGCTGGLLCALAVPVIALWGFALSEGRVTSTAARVVIMSAITAFSVGIGFGKFGKAGHVAKVAFALLAGYALFYLAHGDGGGGYIPGIIAFFVILVDQFSRAE